MTNIVPSGTVVSTSPEVGCPGSFLLTEASGLNPSGFSVL